MYGSIIGSIVYMIILFSWIGFFVHDRKGSRLISDKFIIKIIRTE